MFFLLVWVILGIEALASELSSPLMLLKPVCTGYQYTCFHFLLFGNETFANTFSVSLIWCRQVGLCCLGPVLKENIPIAILYVPVPYLPTLFLLFDSCPCKIMPLLFSLLLMLFEKHYFFKKKILGTNAPCPIIKYLWRP